MAQQRHICVVTETYPPEINGVAFTLARLVDGLLTRGHVVSGVRPQQQATACSRDPDHLQVMLVPGLPIPGYRGLHIGLPAGGLLHSCWTQHHPDVEAMASGLVVVAYHYAAARMHMTHDETGVLVPYGKSTVCVDAAIKRAREP